MKMIHQEPIETFTIDQWCKRRQIAKSFYFKLQKHGKGPRFFRVGAKVLITAQADKDWVAAREAETAEQSRVA
jgi:hypothetical protein